MARVKRTGPRKRRPSEPTPIEWAWLTGAPDANPFLGFFTSAFTSPERLRGLWAKHEDTIRAQWRNVPPAALPYGHPAESAEA